ncbi:hypothetical protein [Nonomuraea dietziae]
MILRPIASSDGQAGRYSQPPGPPPMRTGRLRQAVTITPYRLL